MPSYTYFCQECETSFELFFSIRDYKESVNCTKCKSKNKCSRHYQEDMLTLSSSIKKSDSELSTIGDLANRNRDNLSADEKSNLDKKHNEYKDQELAKQLPEGMSRMKKPNKIKWR